MFINCVNVIIVNTTLSTGGSYFIIDFWNTDNANVNSHKQCSLL